MRVIIQRVSHASCIVNQQLVSTIQYGLMLLVGFTEGDNEETIQKMVKKIVQLRIFEDQNQKMNLSIKDVEGEILSISQFTLYANPYNGNRPSFTLAMHATLAEKYYQIFNDELSKSLGKTVKAVIFGADMRLDIECMGPVTITLEY